MRTTATIMITPVTMETTIMTKAATTLFAGALGAALMLAGLSPALAQSVGNCDWRASAHALVEPWDAPQNTRTFANGNVRLAVSDTIEPGAAALHLVILSPPYGELGGRQCRVVSADGNLGFAGLTLEAMISDYDPAIGLIFAMQASAYDEKFGDILPKTLRVTLNQATGEIQAQLENLP